MSSVVAVYRESCARCGVRTLDDVAAQLDALQDNNDDNNDNNVDDDTVALCVHSDAFDALALRALAPALRHTSCSRRLHTLDFAYCALDNVAITYLTRLLAGGFAALRHVVLTGNPFTYRAAKRLAWMCEGITSLLSRPVTTPPAARRLVATRTAARRLVATRTAAAADEQCCRDNKSSMPCREQQQQQHRPPRRGSDDIAAAAAVAADDDDRGEAATAADVYAWVGWDNNITRVDVTNTLMSTALQACVQRRIAAAIARRDARKCRLRARQQQQQQQQRQQQQRDVAAQQQQLCMQPDRLRHSPSSLSQRREAGECVVVVPHDVRVRRCRAVPIHGCSVACNTHDDHDDDDDDTRDVRRSPVTTATSAMTSTAAVAVREVAGGGVLVQDSYVYDDDDDDNNTRHTTREGVCAADTSVMPTQCVTRDVTLGGTPSSPCLPLAPERLFDWDSLHEPRHYDHVSGDSSSGSSGSSSSAVATTAQHGRRQT